MNSLLRRDSSKYSHCEEKCNRFRYVFLDVSFSHGWSCVTFTLASLASACSDICQDQVNSHKTVRWLFHWSCDYCNWADLLGLCKCVVHTCIGSILSISIILDWQGGSWVEHVSLWGCVTFWHVHSREQYICIAGKGFNTKIMCEPSNCLGTSLKYGLHTLISRVLVVMWIFFIVKWTKWQTIGHTPLCSIEAGIYIKCQMIKYI